MKGNVSMMISSLFYNVTTVSSVFLIINLHTYLHHKGIIIFVQIDTSTYSYMLTIFLSKSNEHKSFIKSQWIS